MVGADAFVIPVFAGEGSFSALATCHIIAQLIEAGFPDGIGDFHWFAIPFQGKVNQVVARGSVGVATVLLGTSLYCKGQYQGEEEGCLPDHLALFARYNLEEWESVQYDHNKLINVLLTKSDRFD